MNTFLNVLEGGFDRLYNMCTLVSKVVRNPVWSAKKALIAFRSKRAMGKNDVIMAMYPKTGSTWVRFFIYNLLQDIEGIEIGSSIDRMNQVMPEFGHESILSVWPFKSTDKLVKTHRPSNLLTRGYKTVLFVRDPRDIVISYYHYANAKKELGFKGSLIDVINHPEMGFGYFFEYFESWRKISKHVVKYEDLRRDPLTTFRLLCGFLGIEASDEQLSTALQKSDMVSMRKAQFESDQFQKKFESNFVFARKGETEEWKKVFSDQELKIWNSYIKKHNFDLYI